MIRRVLRGVRRRLLGGPPPGDYRAYLFEELVAYLDGGRAKRILEIGPKDGADTQRPLDLPRLEASNRVWLDRIGSSRIEYVSANVMYSVRATCHRRVSRDLALARAAYLATRRLTPGTAPYYALAGDEGYEIGKSL